MEDCLWVRNDLVFLWQVRSNRRQAAHIKVYHRGSRYLNVEEERHFNFFDGTYHVWKIVNCFCWGQLNLVPKHDVIIVFVNDVVWADLRLSWCLFEHFWHNQSEFILFARLVWHELPLDVGILWHSSLSQIVNSRLESQKHNIYKVWKL